MISGNVTVLHFPEPDAIEAKCILTIVFASLSLLSAVFVTAVYIRHREVLRRPILDCLIMTIALAFPGSVNLIVGSSLRLTSASLHGYCSLNAYFFQQFTLVEIMMEGYFFALMGWTLAGGSVSYVGVRRGLALFMMCGLLSGTVPLAGLNTHDPFTGYVWGSAMPWCWLPTYDGFDSDGKPSISPKLVAFKFAFGYFWAILAMLCGIGASLVLLRRYLASPTLLHPAIKWRMIYSGFFSAFWMTCLVPRIFAGELSSSQITGLELVLAVVAPGMPFFNSVLFVWLEGVPELLFSSRQRSMSVAATVYDAMKTTDEDDAVLVDPLSTMPSESALDDTHAINDRHEYREHGTAHAIKALHDAADAETRAAKGKLNAKYDEEDGAWIVDLTETRLTEREITQRELTIEAFQTANNVIVKRLESIPKPPISVALSFVGGFCDAIGFVSVGLFTAHVTGNIVLIGVHISNKNDIDTAALIPKIVAIPVFCAAITLVYLAIPVAKHWHRRVMLGCQLTFFLIAFVAAKMSGPWPTVDDQHSPGAWIAGMFLVSGMAVQNSYQRVHLVGLPMTTFMSGNTNQIVHDTIEMIKKKLVIWRNASDSPEATAAKNAMKPIYARFKIMSQCWVAFFSGCMLASLIYRYWTVWAFLVPPFAVAGIVVVFWDETRMEKKKD